MLLTHLTIAFRNLIRNKLLSLINIGGLAIGLTCCVFIFYYVYDELTYDRFHLNSDKIFRITSNFVDPPNTTRIRFTDQKIGPYLKRQYPQIKEVVRMDKFSATFKVDETIIQESAILAVDPTVFDVFTYPLIAGSPNKVFEQLNSIVLSESLAAKYFQGEALGKTLLVNGKMMEVTGIMEDVPANSDKWVNGFVNGNFPGEEIDGLQVRFDTYILLREGVTRQELQSIVDKAATVLWKQDTGDAGLKYEIQALSELHFTHGIQWDQTKGDKGTLNIFLSVSFILLLVVIFNFVNLSTVKSLERAKEVGVRKISGANRFHLIKQFVAESFLTTVLAGGLSVLLVILLYSVFHLITGKTIELTSYKDMGVVLVSILFLILLTLVSSFYPAIVLSSYKPVLVLKGRFFHHQTNKFIPRFFIIAQFGLCTSVLVFLWVVTLQMKQIQQSDLGFDSEQVLVAEVPSDGSIDYIKSEIQQRKDVIQVSAVGANSLPGENIEITPVWFTSGGDRQEIQVQRVEADANYADVLQFHLVKGSPIERFPESQWNDLALVNETFAKDMGWDDPLNQSFEIFDFNGNRKLTVVGVLRDFHFSSLHNRIPPLFYCPKSSGGSYLLIRLQPQYVEQLRAALKQYLPNSSLNSWFLSESFEKQYKSEKILSLLLISFSSLTLLVAGLGLYGLTSHRVETRTKEISVRKVLGATTQSLIVLLSREFIGLILIGAIIGSLWATYFSADWLNSFAYKIEWSSFQIAIPMLVILSMSLIIVAYRIYGITKLNASDSLKCE